MSDCPLSESDKEIILQNTRSMNIGYGELIRGRREEINISLRALARKTNISAAFLCDIEHGRRCPSDHVLKNLKKHLGPLEN
jgi:ribosome-binding protein aMBF1 (putative translation factor)